MKKVLCKLGFHKWIENHQPIIGHRNLDHWNEDHSAMIIECGPEETFYPGHGIIPLSRDCERCGNRQIEYCGRWV